MIKPSKNMNRFLAWFFSTVVAAGSLTACEAPPVAVYGPPSDQPTPTAERQIQISGIVVAKKDRKPVSGIRIEVVETQSSGITGSNGQYLVDVLDRSGLNKVHVKVIDIDGEVNGSFKQQESTLDISREHVNEINFEMETEK